MKGNAFKSDKLKENNRFSILKEESTNKDIRRDDIRDDRRDDRKSFNNNNNNNKKFFINDSPKKEIIPILNELNFPLFGEKTEIGVENNPAINYSNAIRSENIEINVEKAEVVLPGWVKISKGNGTSNGYSNFEYGISTIIEPIEPSFNDQMNEVINNMNDKWENYKEDYINLYGIDEYENNHLMLNREIEYDSDYE
jgi:hypothetical protein